MNLQSKLAILADAAKYDASCASSGAAPRNSVGGRGMGSTEGMGICHSYAPDGRCISLLKILLTNFCQYDCLYCVNRVTSNVARARFTVDEVVQLTLDFYRRNCIEGLFLSSGIIQSPDYTMEQVVEVARVLREEHDFRGYIHLKTIPDASPELMERAGHVAAHAVHAVQAVVLAEVGEQNFQQRDAAPIGRVAVADAHALGGPHAPPAHRVAWCRSAGRARGVVFGGVGQDGKFGL